MPLKLCRLWQMRHLLTTFVFSHQLCLLAYPPFLFLKGNTTDIYLKCRDPSRKKIMLAAVLAFTYLNK